MNRWSQAFKPRDGRRSLNVDSCATDQWRVVVLKCAAEAETLSMWVRKGMTLTSAGKVIENRDII